MASTVSPREPVRTTVCTFWAPIRPSDDVVLEMVKTRQLGLRPVSL